MARETETEAAPESAASEASQGPSPRVSWGRNRLDGSGGTPARQGERPAALASCTGGWRTDHPTIEPRAIPDVAASLRVIASRVLAISAVAGAMGCAVSPGRAASPEAGACGWPVAPVVLRQTADTVYQSWTYDADRLPASADPSRLPALAAFLDTVRGRVGALDARALLRRQVAFYASRPDSDSQGEAANGRLVLGGSAGALRPASCLEALLVEEQAARFPMTSHPTEFHALVMERGEAGARQVRVYFAGSGAPWPPKADPLLERVAADRREGWRAVAHLHNHPFLFANGDIAGANAPSLSDVQFWRFLRESYGIESARVTNGFATFQAPAAAFSRLRARGDR